MIQKSKRRFVVLIGVLIGLLYLSPAWAGKSPGGGQESDWVDLDLNDDVHYCGVGKLANPWILQVAVTNHDTVVHDLRIEIQDESGTTFKIPAGSSFSFSHVFGAGGPDIDSIVRISSPTAALNPSPPNPAVEGFASVLARAGAEDPFDGDGEKRNYCVSILDEGPVATSLSVPNSWVVDGDGSDGGTLKGKE